MLPNLAETLDETVDSLEISTKIVNACADAKARDIAVFNAARVSDVANYYIIASGHSDRQVQGISNRILEVAGSLGVELVGIEGFDKAHWVILDFGDVIAHVFYEPMRPHYNLEGLWARAAKLEIRKRPRSRSLLLRESR